MPTNAARHISALTEEEKRRNRKENAFTGHVKSCLTEALYKVVSAFVFFFSSSTDCRHLSWRTITRLDKVTINVIDRVSMANAHSTFPTSRGEGSFRHYFLINKQYNTHSGILIFRKRRSQLSGQDENN